MNKDELGRIGKYTAKGQFDLRNLSPEELDDFAKLVSLRIVEGELAELFDD